MANLRLRKVSLKESHFKGVSHERKLKSVPKACQTSQTDQAQAKHKAKTKCKAQAKDTFNAANIRRCGKYVRQIQRRLDEAVASNDKAKVRWYTHLLTKRSRAAKVLAVYHVTVENQGKYTAGIDGESLDQKASKPEKDRHRLKLLERIHIEKKPSPVRRVYIDKGNGKKRPLGIPTLLDRIIQDLLRMALEPLAEYQFHENSYGFRPKRNCHDAIAHLFIKLAPRRSPQWVIEGDIKGCFDHISHRHILETMAQWNVPGFIREIVHQMLKAKVAEKEQLFEVAEGTPQGGIISPLLANIALTALDDYCESLAPNNPLVRYADDFVVVCPSEADAQRIKEKIAQFLQDQIGLTLSTEKTLITHISRGFHFLGFHLRKYGEKLLIKPQKEKVVKFLRGISQILTGNKAAEVGTILRLLNPKLQGFALYYRHVVSKAVFSWMDNELWKKLWRWAKRRHPRKSRRWVRRKYFTRRRVFTDVKGQHLLEVERIPIVRHVKVRSDVRVYGKEEQTREYWDQRARRNTQNQVYTVRGGRLLKDQQGSCHYCGQPLGDWTEVHLHHLWPRSEGGAGRLNNLQPMHWLCHQELHERFTRKQMAGFAGKGIDYARSSFVSSPVWPGSGA
jgi:RNA-directed DNA polymerase